MANVLFEPVSRPSVCDHLVQVYRDPSELADSVAVFLGAGFEAGEAAIVVATAAHWPVFSARLEQHGWNTAELEAAEMLFVADAETTLASILEDGKPSFRLFGDVIGGLMDRAGSPSRRVRVFGEMVDLLCRRGDAAGADALEDLWNRLGARRSFSLLCGYKVDVFDRETQVTILPQVCRSHSQMLPARDPERMDRAVDAALIETLGAAGAQKVYAQAARQGVEHVPAAQVALMWLSAQMPRSAERVLSAARTHYLDASNLGTAQA